MARELAEKMGVDPLEFLLRLLKKDTYVQTIIKDDGKKERVEIAVSIELKIDAAKHLSQYMYPRLLAQSITGDDGAPIEISRPDFSVITSDPKLLEAAQVLAIGLATAGRELPGPSAPDPGPRDQEPQDMTLDLQRDSHGHWRPK